MSTALTTIAVAVPSAKWNVGLSTRGRWGMGWTGYACGGKRAREVYVDQSPSIEKCRLIECQKTMAEVRLVKYCKCGREKKGKGSRKLLSLVRFCCWSYPNLSAVDDDSGWDFFGPGTIGPTEWRLLLLGPGAVCRHR